MRFVWLIMKHSSERRNTRLKFVAPAARFRRCHEALGFEVCGSDGPEAVLAAQVGKVVLDA